MSSLSEKWLLVSFVVGGVSFTKEWTVECQLELSPDIDLLLWDIQGLLALPTPAPVVRINIFMQYDYVLWGDNNLLHIPIDISDKNRVSQTGTNVLEWEKQWPKWPREIIGILYAGNFWNLTFSGTSCINHHCEKACYIPMYKKGWSRSRSGLIFCRMKILTKPRKKLKIAMLLSQWGQSATQSLDAVRLSFTMWQLIFAGIDTHLYNIWTFTVIVSVHSWQWAA